MWAAWPCGRSTTSWTTREGRGGAWAAEGRARALSGLTPAPASLCRKLHKKLGQQAWLVAAITVTELLIVVKYDPHTLTLSLPFYIAQCWTLGSVLALTWTVWRFFLR